MHAMADERPPVTEWQRNIWAPWRMEYIRTLGGGDECFICRDRDAGEDRENLILWRTPRCLVMLNRFPYTGGHSLIAPLGHIGELADLDVDTLRETVELIRDLQAALRRVLHPHGFNVGLNVGAAAGAGLPGHLHWHLVPRWSGDTNFMPVFTGNRVIPQYLEDLYDELQAASTELRLPNVSS